MKKVSLFFTLLLGVALSAVAQTSAPWDGTVATAFAGGAGTQAAPYLISSGSELAYLAQFTNTNNEYGTQGKYYKLTQNINLAGRQWTPIGAYDGGMHYFLGHFDGAGYAVERLSIVDTLATSAFGGVFGVIKNATIQNLGVESGEIIVKGASNGYAYAGGIAHTASNSQIKNCYNHAAIRASGGMNGYCKAGGIVGFVNFDLINGSNSEISGCYNTGQISSGYYAGGIVGDVQFLEMYSCFIKLSYNKGEISGNLSQAGGISGNRGSIVDCYNRGNIHVTNANDTKQYFIAGIIARISARDSIRRAYTTGTMHADVYRPSSRNYTITASDGADYANCYYLESVIAGWQGTAFTNAQTSDLVGWLNGTPSSFVWQADVNNENDGYPIFNTAAVNISFRANGGAELAPLTYMMRLKFGEAELPTPVREGCTFAGWYRDEALTTKVNAAQAIGNHDLTLYAKWQATITFNANGGTVSPATKAYFADVAFGSAFPTPVRSGYVFAGWASDSTMKTVASVGDIARKNATFHARWKVNIKLNTQGGDALAPHAYVGGLAYDFTPNDGLPTPTKAGYVFGGWHGAPAYDSLRQNSDVVPPANPDTLYAHWGYERVAVAFDPANGSDLTTKEYYPNRPYNQTFTLDGAAYNNGFPADPTLPNAQFLGWYNERNERAYPSDSSLNYTHILHAKWNYKITVYFNANGGSEVEPRQYYPDYAYSYGSIGNPGLPPNPTMPDAVFVGWFATPDLSYYAITNSSYVSKEITTLYAHWSYKVAVNFVTNNETTLPSKDLYFGFTYGSSQNSYYTLPTPTKVGDTYFEGWYDSPDFTNKVTNTSYVEQNKTTLYARWSSKVTVNFVTNNASTLPAKELHSGFSYLGYPNIYSLQNPTKIGDSVFVAWHDSPDFTNKVTNASIVNQAKTTLYAQWSYKVPISFEANGGAPIAPQYLYFGYTYSQYPNSYSLPKPTKTGCKFMGWYNSQTFTNEVANASLVEGAATLYARWSEQVSVSFNTNGGNAIASKTFYTDYQYQSSGINTGLPTPTKGDAYFAGWYDSPNLTGTAITNSNFVVRSATTLYAKWSERVNVVFIDYELDTVRTRSYYHGVGYNATPNTGLLAPVSPYTPTFLGWHARIVGLQNRIENSTTAPNRHATLFAKWGIEVTFECNGGAAIGKQVYTPNNAHTLYAKWGAAPVHITPKYTVTITTPSNGIISVKNGEAAVTSGTQLDSGTVLTLTVTPNAGYTFTKWWDNSTTANRSFELKKNVSISATFTAVAVTGVTLKAATTLLIGGTEQLSAAVQPANAANKNVAWSSSMPSVATVSSAGLVTAISVGKTVITVKTADGNQAATCVVTVTATAVAVTSVSVSKTTATLTVGSSEQLTATVNPTNATNQNVTWSCDNNSVATVNSSTGLVTAVAAGTATITVKTNDGNKTATCTVTVGSTVTPPQTAVAANELLPLTLYPTVVSEQLTVNNEQWNTVGANAIRPNSIRPDIEIYSMSGALVAKVPTAGAQTTINVSQLPSGTYVVRVGKYAGKFVK